MSVEFERQVTFGAAFDRRHKDPSKNYGVHGVDIRFVLKGARGAVQFVLYTNWHLPHVRDEFLRKLDDAARPSHDTELFFCPLPADLGYHSPKPRWEGQEEYGRDDCKYLNGARCYYDGSGLNAEPVYDALLKGGSDAVWKYLEDYYASTFVNDDDEASGTAANAKNVSLPTIAKKESAPNKGDTQ